MRYYSLAILFFIIALLSAIYLGFNIIKYSNISFISLGITGISSLSYIILYEIEGNEWKSV